MDRAGNRTAVTEELRQPDGSLNIRHVAYTYDNLERLASETITGDAVGPNGVICYAYDLVGNRLSRTSSVAGVSNQTQTFNADDQIVTSTEDGATLSYLHDANGNTLSDGRHTYTYDSRNRLITEDAGTSGEVDIRYDGDGHKIAETGSGVTTAYLVDDLNDTGYPQTMEELQGGQVIRRYDWGSSLINETQLVTSGAVWQSSFYGFDGHSSVRFLTDTAGVVTDTSTYEAYGLTIASTGSTWNTYHFASQWRDTLIGNDFLNARWENVNNGAFFTMDTYAGRFMEPQTLHRYVINQGNPTNKNDPTGHFTQDDGYEAEFKIQEQYEATHGDNDVEYGRKIQQLHIKPDIIDYTSEEFYEIKPFTLYGVTTGAAQLATYTLAFSLSGIKAGRWTPPNRYITIGGYPAALFNVGGVVFYTDRINSIRELAALGTMAAAREMLAKIIARQSLRTLIATGINANSSAFSSDIMRDSGIASMLGVLGGIGL